MFRKRRAAHQGKREGLGGASCRRPSRRREQGEAEGARLARDAAQSEGSGKTAMEALVKESKEREVLPTHRQVPTKSSSKPTKRPR